MIDFITDNFFWIIGVGLFLIFALIGYLVDSVKNKNVNKSQVVDNNVNNNMSNEVNLNVNDNNNATVSNNAQSTDNTAGINLNNVK